MSEHDSSPSPQRDAPSPSPAPSMIQPIDEQEISRLREAVTQATRQVYDPELPLNIYDLGLIYSIEIDSSHHVHVTMTLTNPACPVAGTLPKEVEVAIVAVEGVASAEVTLTWTPSWSKDRLSPEHQLLFSTFM